MFCAFFSFVRVQVTLPFSIARFFLLLWVIIEKNVTFFYLATSFLSCFRLFAVGSGRCSCRFGLGELGSSRGSCSFCLPPLLVVSNPPIRRRIVPVVFLLPTRRCGRIRGLPACLWILLSQLVVTCRHCGSA